MGRLNYNELKDFIERDSKSGCELITSKEEYINTHQKISIICRCGNQFETTYKAFSRKKTPKQQCNECGLKNRINKRTLTLEELQIEIDKKFKGEFEILGEFKNRKTHTRFKHKICNYEWLTTPDNFLRSKGCPRCNKR